MNNIQIDSRLPLLAKSGDFDEPYQSATKRLAETAADYKNNQFNSLSDIDNSISFTKDQQGNYVIDKQATYDKLKSNPKALFDFSNEIKKQEMQALEASAKIKNINSEASQRYAKILNDAVSGANEVYNNHPALINGDRATAESDATRYYHSRINNLVQSGILPEQIGKAVPEKYSPLDFGIYSSSPTIQNSAGMLAAAVDATNNSIGEQQQIQPDAGALNVFGLNGSQISSKKGADPTINDISNFVIRSGHVVTDSSGNKIADPNVVKSFIKRYSDAKQLKSLGYDPIKYEMSADGTPTISKDYINQLKQLESVKQPSQAKMTESQARAASYLALANNAMSVLDSPATDDKGNPLKGKNGQIIPVKEVAGSPGILETIFGDVSALGIKNQITTRNRQAARAAQGLFVEQILKLQTGANGPQSEIVRYIDSYFPQYGEDQSIAKIKEQFRNTALEAMRLVASGKMSEDEASQVLKDNDKSLKSALSDANKPYSPDMTQQGANKDQNVQPLQNHIDQLRSNPELATLFDKKYGPGSSLRYLNKR